MSDQPAYPADAPSLSGVVLLGLMKGRAHAAHFPPADAALAERAASLMQLHVLPVQDEPEYCDLVGQVAKGKIFATSGRGFVPFCKTEIYTRLCRLGGIDPTATLASVDQPAPSEGDEEQFPAPPVRLPVGWDDLGPGCLCLASEGEDQGWYEAVVIEVVADGLVVAWRDFDPAEYPPLTRRADQLALLPPGTGELHKVGSSEATA